MYVCVYMAKTWIIYNYIYMEFTTCKLHVNEKYEGQLCGICITCVHILNMWKFLQMFWHMLCGIRQLKIYGQPLNHNKFAHKKNIYQKSTEQQNSMENWS